MKRRKFNSNNRDGGRDGNHRGIHVAMQEHGDGAFVAGLVRVVVNELMQRGTRRRGGQEQHDTHQPGSDYCRANPPKMTCSQLQTICF